MWLKFLQESTALYCRPFMDMDNTITALELGFHMDSSANPRLGFGGIIQNRSWFFGQWEPGYIEQYKPSIEYLELYAVCVGLFIWAQKFKKL